MSRTDPNLLDVARQAEGLRAVLDTAPIDTEVTVTVARTRSLVVSNAATYASAGEHLKGYKALADRIKAYFEEDVERAHKLWKSLTTKRKAALDDVEAESERLRGQRQIWKAEQDRLQREAEQQESLNAQKREQDRLAAEAALLEQQGQPELAAAVIEQAITAPAPVVVLPSFVPKDLPKRLVYKWRVINEALIPREFLTRDDKKLTAYSNAMKGAARVPGIEFYTEEIDIVRS
jgi:hypothetical protein